MSNVDAILATGKPLKAIPAIQMVNTPQSEPIQETNSVHEDTNEELVSKETNYSEVNHNEDNTPITEQKNEESSIDEYGNQVKKERLYTQQEVQEIVRKRVSKIKNVPQDSRQDYQQKPVQDNQSTIQNQSDDEAWKKELWNANDQWFEQKQRELEQKRWQQIEEEKQADFEARFNIGMDKYSDFNKVVMGKPIHNAMLMGIRHLEDPAACIYTASKLHPAELERISKIPDPFQQASEMGRLHERMIKERKVTTSASKPLESHKGDMPIKNPETISTNINSKEYQSNLERRIAEHAKQKFKR